MPTETVSFATFNPPQEKLYWYRPQFKPDATGLQWQMAVNTYDQNTHNIDVEQYLIDFPEYQITDPVLARCLVALPQMTTTSLVHFKKILDANKGIFYQRLNVDKPFTRVVTPYSKVLEKDGGILHSRLTGTLLSTAIPKLFSYYDLFDRAIVLGDSDRALPMVSDFVAFYNGARTTVVKGAKLEAESQRKTDPDSYAEYIKKIKIGPLSDSDINLKLNHTPRFERIIEQLEQFMHSLSQVTAEYGDDLSNGLTTDQKLQAYATYINETKSGIKFLVGNTNLRHTIPPAAQLALVVDTYVSPTGESMEPYETEYLQDFDGNSIASSATLSLPDRNKLVTNPGKCPFLHQAYKDPNQL